MTSVDMRKKRVRLHGGNPDPVQTEGFKAQQFEAAPDVPPEMKLAKTPSCVNLPLDDDRHVRSQPNKTAWLRAAVREKIEREDTEGETVQHDNAIAPEQLQEHITAVLLSIPPRQRKDAAKLFKKLVDRLQPELAHSTPKNKLD